MASSLLVTLLFLAAVVLDPALTHKAIKFYRWFPNLVGLQDVDVSDEGVQQAVDFAIQKYNDKSKDLYLSRVVQVVCAREQVVAGINYYLDLEIVRTTCAKDKSSQDVCPFREDPMQLCSFVVYSRPWERFLSLLRFS
ncbi:cystatin-C-like [Octodon degus]|uniref:Cystatin-C-like n=1 Tax=Octodon degus TaxID=10160 RepID=A0A6P6EU89_OCTDE|nr:cystatin-C-like [Octodon degus]